MVVTTEASWVPLARWLLLSVVLGAFPVGGTVLWQYFTGATDPWGPGLNHGQLLIAAVGLSAASLSRLIRRSLSDTDMLLCFIALIQALVGAFLFALASTTQTQAGRLVPASVFWWIIAAIVGIFCVRSAP
jgi:hypothetical protein